MIPPDGVASRCRQLGYCVQPSVLTGFHPALVVLVWPYPPPLGKPHFSRWFLFRLVCPSACGTFVAPYPPPPFPISVPPFAAADPSELRKAWMWDERPGIAKMLNDVADSMAAVGFAEEAADLFERCAGSDVNVMIRRNFRVGIPVIPPLSSFFFLCKRESEMGFPDGFG